MDRIGKQIRYCESKKCCAPFRQKPVKVYTIFGICKYCVKADEKVTETIREFEVSEAQKTFKDNKPKELSNINYSKEEKEREELRLKRKEESKQVKNKSRLKGRKSIKKKTTKQSSIETAYHKIQAEILEERKHCCEGCGDGSKTLTFSHRVSRKRRRDLITEKENIDLYCLDCHENVETGRWDLLLNGKAVSEYIKRVEPELYFIYLYKNQKIA